VALCLCVALAACSGGGGGDGDLDSRAEAGPDICCAPEVPAADVPAEADLEAPTDVPGSADADAAEAVDAAPADAAPPAAPAVRFDPAGGFYAWPFPSLLRTRPNGAPDYSSVPNPKGLAVVTKYVDATHELVDGASCNGPVFFGLTREPAADGLPDVAGSLEAGATVFLVDVDPQSPEYLRRVPVSVSVVTDAVEGYFEPPLLVVQPLFGVPLRGATLYAAVVTTGLTAADGTAFSAPALLAGALAGAAPADVQAALQPLVDAAAALGQDPGAIAGATVFRTLDPTRELVALHQSIVDRGLAPTLADVTVAKDHGSFWRIDAHLSTWNFQQGAPPYAQGGGFTYGADGVAVAKPESLDVAFSIPKAPLLTAAGSLPLVIYSHGTGGDFDSFISEEVAEELASVGVACVSLPQPMHGRRWAGSTNLAVLELASFNFSNPRAGVTTFRQAALDNVLLVQWLVAGGVLPLAATEVGVDVTFDALRLAFMGHSQGALVAPLVLGVEPRLRGGLVSAGGGVLIETILYRKSLDASASTQIRDVVAKLLQIDAADLDERHPMLVLVQNASDLTDPINYARLVNGPGNRKHLMQVQGGQDPYTPLSTALNLAVALRLPTLAYPNVTASSDHPGAALLDLGTVSLPVSGNVAVAGGDPITGALLVFPASDHFPVFHQNLAKNLYKGFFASLAVDEPPVIR
jgi:hypothetical protein